MENTMHKLLMNEVVCENTVRMMAQDEVIIPEQKSDMAKVVEINANAAVSDFMCMDGGIDTTGKAELNVIYIPDNDARIACSFKCEVDFSQRIDDASVRGDDKCILSARVVCVDYNILNPRKISVRVIFEVMYKCTRQSENNIIESFNADSGIAQRTRSMSVYQNISDTHAKFSVKELLNIDENKPGASALLDTKCYIDSLETRTVTGKVAVRGVLNIASVYATDDNRLDFCSHEVPFTEVFDAPGASESAVCDTDIYICSSSASLKADEYGNMRAIESDVLIGINISISDVSEAEFVSDCYGIGAPLECETKKINICSPCGSCEESYSVKSLLAPPMGTAMVQVYHASAKPYITSAEMQNGKIAVRGYVDFCVSFISDSPHMPLGTLHNEEEFEFILSGADGAADSCEVSARCISFTCNINMAGAAEAKASIGVGAKTFENRDIDFYISGELGEEKRKKSPRINVYFAKTGDTLWDIAKRYGVDSEELLDINHIENADKINEGRQILIPEF